MKCIYSFLLLLSVHLASCQFNTGDKGSPTKEDLDLAIGKGHVKSAILYVTAKNTNDRIWS
jgi:hypothetical protein